MLLAVEENRRNSVPRDSSFRLDKEGGKIVHIPVMVKEVFSILIAERRVKEGVIVDGTVGTGGHLSYLLKNSPPGITFLGIDIDPEAVQFSQNLFRGRKNVIIKQGNYANLSAIVAELDLAPIIGFLFDLGLSKFQLESAKRGFSFRREGPLDMRFSQEGKTALDLIRRLNRQELEKIILAYGEEKDYRRIAQAIIEERRRIATTLDLKTVISQVTKREDRKKLARVFQALRIAVNCELENVRNGVERAISLLTKGGRLVVITYHSLEDRIVKRILKDKSQKKEILIITGKPLTPTLMEIKSNPSSRSAKLRAIEKI